jgi:hypothetical protein
MRPILTILLLAAAVSAQTLTAKINDSKSHGLLGDNYLSLDEAVRLANDDTFRNQLSAAERAQLIGLGSLLGRIEIDAATVPVITYERDLTPIVTVMHSHQDLDVVGIAGPAGAPVLDAGATAAVFPVRTNHAHVLGLVLKGGKAGLDYDTTGHYHAGSVCELKDSVVTGQTEAAVRVRVPASQPGLQVPMVLDRLVIRGAPIGVDILDSGQFAAVTIVAERLEIVDCGVGINAVLNSRNQGASAAEFFRCNVRGAQSGLRVRRDSLSDSQFFFRLVHGEFVVTGSGLDVQGSNTADTILHHHHLVVRAGPGSADYALVTSPRTARFDIHGTENRMDGNVLIQGNLSSRRLYLHNNRYANGTFTVDWAGVPPEKNIHWDTFTSMPVVIATGSRTPVTFEACDFVRSPITGNATLGVATLLECFLASSPIAGNVTNTNPIPAQWIGGSTVSPIDPPLGGFVDFQVDLHPGTAVFWMLNTSRSRPRTTNDPFRFYLAGFELNEPAPFWLPGIYVLRDRLRIPVPNDPALRGLELYGQPVLVGTMQQPYIPPFSLPIGGRFVIGG